MPGKRKKKNKNSKKTNSNKKKDKKKTKKNQQQKKNDDWEKNFFKESSKKSDIKKKSKIKETQIVVEDVPPIHGESDVGLDISDLCLKLRQTNVTRQQAEDCGFANLFNVLNELTKDLKYEDSKKHFIQFCLSKFATFCNEQKIARTKEFKRFWKMMKYVEDIYYCYQFILVDYILEKLPVITQRFNVEYFVDKKSDSLLEIDNLFTIGRNGILGSYGKHKRENEKSGKPNDHVNEFMKWWLDDFRKKYNKNVFFKPGPVPVDAIFEETRNKESFFITLCKSKNVKCCEKGCEWNTFVSGYPIHLRYQLEVSHFITVFGGDEKGLYFKNTMDPSKVDWNFCSKCCKVAEGKGEEELKRSICELDTEILKFSIRKIEVEGEDEEN